MINENDLFFGSQIELDHGLGTIYQPTLNDLLTNKIELNDILIPFIVDKDKLLKDSSDITNFEMFSIQAYMIYCDYLRLTKDRKDFNEWFKDLEETSNLLIYKLINILKLLYHTDNVNFNLNKNIIIDDNYILDSDNYDYMCDVIFEILSVEKKEIIEEETLDEIQKEFKRLREKYNKNKKEKSITLIDMCNYIIHSDNSNLRYIDVKEFTIYQLKNTFKMYQKKENYDISKRQFTSGNFKIEKVPDHWFFK